MAKPSGDLFRVTLLGTGAPPPKLDRFGPSTLIEVGNEKFIVDAGRGAMQRIYQLTPATRRKYSGPLVVGEDLLQIQIGENIETWRFGHPTGNHRESKERTTVN
jgi:hypothetical protein